MRITVFVFVLLGILACNAQTNKQQLSDAYSITWTVDALYIQLSVQVKTTGWIGFGIGEPTSGSMPGADMVVGWVDSTGKATIQDMYATAFAKPDLDACQNWELTGSSQALGITTLDMKRLLVTNDTQDRPIIAGPVRIVWAFGTSTTLSYHGANRGASVVTFFGGVSQNTTEKVTSATFVMPSAIIPTAKNTYICQSFALPNVTDAHVIEINPLIQAHNGSTNMVHHMLVHVCDPSDFWQKYRTYGQCASPTGNLASGCSGIMFEWAVGSGSLLFPKEAGFRIGSSKSHSVRYIIVEIHYNNALQKANVVDNSGIQLLYTPTLRKYDAGVITLGDLFVTLPAIPAGRSATEYETNCPSECTSAWPHDITVFSSGAHMHYAGKQQWTTQWRDGKLLALPFNRVDFYVYEFQQQTLRPTEIKRGDRLNTHCIYNTADRTADTKFGIATEDEMCMNFFAYYPVMLMPQPYTYCGQVRSGGIARTYCGPYGSSSIKSFTNPTVKDPAGTGNITFGLAPSVCKKSEKPSPKVAIVDESNTGVAVLSVRLLWLSGFMIVALALGIFLKRK